MQKDDATWLRTALTVWACLTAFVFWKFFMFAGLRAGLLERFEASFNIGGVIVAILLGGVVTWLIARDSERYEYLLASVGELRKVHWPDWDHTKKLTTIVCVVVAIFSLILTVFDMAWAKILKLLLA